MTSLTSLGLLGCGNMGGAIARGVVAAKLLPSSSVFVFDSAPVVTQPLEALGCKGITSPEELFQNAEAVVLSEKPQVFKTLTFPALANGAPKTIISVMAGIRTEKLREVFPNSFTIIRVMPNLGLAVGEGATAIATDGLNEESLQLAESIFRSCGQTVRVMEEQLDAVTGVSGSGPMYVFEFIEALTQAGIKSGLSRETAYRLAIQTAKGSLKLLESSDDAPSVWSARVRSPGGTTAEAQKVLERDGFQDIIDRAVQAAVARSKELSS